MEVKGVKKERGTMCPSNDYTFGEKESKEGKAKHPPFTNMCQ